ncbi:type VII secretion system (Wss) protein YukD [Kineococcus xinjiangensis]|uniref:Type VII secretion system (Wss) protein YukD n=2 Tax=Kineococcus xinjiangensis TaxID=512762 RepID=A0A2S6ICI3_9ACTN|nr:type VII secretion system (Wss) protein YukD [Kineococcus xinjiangensis]
MSATSDLTTSGNGHNPWLNEVASLGGDDACSATRMHWLNVKVVTPTGALDITLPDSRPVAEIIDELTSRLAPGAPLSAPAGGWHLHRLGGAAFRPGQPLAALKLRDGDVLYLSAERTPDPARPVDDRLLVMAEGAGLAGRWNPRSMSAFATAATALTAAAAVAAAHLALPGVAALPLVLAAGLLTAAVALRRTRTAAGEAAALASLPAWAGAGLSAATFWSAGVAAHATLAGVGLLLGALAAAAVAPQRMPWWSFTWAAAGVTAALATLSGTRALALGQAAAITAVMLLLLSAALPWLITRSGVWSAPARRAGTTDAAGLRVLARAHRQLLNAVTAAFSAGIAACAALLIFSGDPLQQGLAAALAVVTGLRARRSSFAVESGSMLAAALTSSLLLLSVLAVHADLRLRLLVLAAALLLLVLLLATVAALQAGAGTARADAATAGLARFATPRLRRALDVSEVIVAITIMPLLLGALGVYTAAANTGAQL